MQPSVDPEEQNQTQFYGQPQYLGQQIQQTQGAFPQQQVIILNEKFRPRFNFRYLSFAVLGIGMTASIIFSNVRIGGDADQYLRFLSEASCCLSILLAFVFDAVYYNGKANWQVSIGKSNTFSITNMILNILFASLVIIFGYFWFIGD